MAEKMTFINPAMLKWARIMSGISLENVADLRFERERIESWEQGTDYPTYTQLKDLASSYRKPVAIFFFPVPPNIKNIPASFRTLPSEIYTSLSKEIVKMQDDARVMQLNLYELNDNVNPCKNKITSFSFMHNNLGNIATDLRKLTGITISEQKTWKKTADAFEHWRDCFFSLGIYVFKSAFGDNSISGFCLYDAEFPVIYVNNSFSFSRQIFTLFHEIYHIIHETSGIDLLNDNALGKYKSSLNDDIEKSCNAFAGEFLVPNIDFERVIRNSIITDENIEKWAAMYSVSREVILRKLLDRGKISSEQYEAKQHEYNSDYLRFQDTMKKADDSSSGNYYNTQMAYKGKHYLELTFRSFYSQKINLTQLSQYLNMKIPSVRAIAAKKGWGNI